MTIDKASRLDRRLPPPLSPLFLLTPRDELYDRVSVTYVPSTSQKLFSTL